MRRLEIILLFLCLGVLGPRLSASAQNTPRETDLSMKVHFSAGSSVFEASFMENASSLGHFLTGIDSLMNDRTRMIYTISVNSMSSPEGSNQANEKVALERSKTLRDILLERTALSPYQIKAQASGTDWEGLRHAVASSGQNWADKALSVIDSPSSTVMIDGRECDSRVLRLRELDEGVVWDYLLDNVFPTLRYATARVECLLSPQLALEVREGHRHYRDTLVISHKDTLYIINEYKAPVRNKQRKEYRNAGAFRTAATAFRTNLLLPLTNVGLEVPVNNRISIEADWYSPWIFRNWMNAVSQPYGNCFQMQALQLCTRIWLGRNHRMDADSRYRLMGHSIGIGLAGAIYDLEMRRNGQQGNVAAIGLDYTYALPVSKGDVRFEFSLGVCAYYNYKRDYFVEKDDSILYGKGPWTDSFGVAPFRVGVSLVVPINKKKKEEAR